MTPLVSIVIPTFNQPAYLIQAMASVFAQTFTDFELIIVDDGSTDSTPAALQAAHLRGWKFTLISQPNAGVGAARDRGIAAARGKYVALLDHDDLWEPEKLAIQTEFYQKHQECSVVSAPWGHLNADGTATPDAFSISPDESATGIIDRPLRHLANANIFLMSSTMLFDRARAAGLTHARQRQCIEDSPFHIGLFARGPAGIAGFTPPHPRPLMWYRVHPTNTSAGDVYFYNGLAMLRQMQRSGSFDDIGEQRPDLEAFVGYIARHAAVEQLLANHRRRALGVYFRELIPQFKLGRWKYLLTLPPLALAPQSTIRRAFHM
jgi:glycosyltransferase involved in cell wall biosynthesis